MHINDFDYALPPSAIAAHPAEPRDAARLLDLRGPDFHDRVIKDLPDLLEAGDVLVVNNTRVIPAQLSGRKDDSGGAKISATIHKKIAPDTWACLAKPAKKLRVGDKIIFAENFTAEIIAIGEGGARDLQFNCAGDALDAALEKFGRTPLPPYIPRAGGATQKDAKDYQTLFARHKGAVAAPTAGLHFTDALMARLADKGIETAEITLHVGAGTFLPVQCDDPRAHKMHAEAGEITGAAADTITRAKKNSRRIVAVGTTSLRILEACHKNHGAVQPWRGETDLFILPGFNFGVVDVLLTNFHLPKSTLLMLVAAFAGHEKIKRAYAHAIAKGYRFFSYGDACLMTREQKHE